MLINPPRQTLALRGHVLSHLVGGVGLGNGHPHLVDEEPFLKKKKKIVNKHLKEMVQNIIVTIGPAVNMILPDTWEEIMKCPSIICMCAFGIWNLREAY